MKREEIIEQRRQKREQERLQRYRNAVRVLANRRARKIVESEFKDVGLKPQYMPPREIKTLAQDYLANHREELIAEAINSINTWPGFAYLRLEKPGPVSDR